MLIPEATGSSNTLLFLVQHPSHCWALQPVTDLWRSQGSHSLTLLMHPALYWPYTWDPVNNCGLNQQTDKVNGMAKGTQMPDF